MQKKQLWIHWHKYWDFTCILIMAQENEIIYVDNDGDVNNTNDPITQISLASTSVTAYSRLFQGNNRNSSSYSNELRLLQANIKSGTNSSVRNQRSEKAVTAPSCSHDNSKIKDASQPAASYSHCPAQAATDCPICMEPYAFGGDSGRRCIVTPCGHVFCHTCITQFIASNKKSNCPTCRAPFGKKIKSQLVTLFDVKVCAVDNMELERISKLLEQERKRYALVNSAVTMYWVCMTVIAGILWFHSYFSFTRHCFAAGKHLRGEGSISAAESHQGTGFAKGFADTAANRDADAVEFVRKYTHACSKQAGENLATSLICRGTPIGSVTACYWYKF